MVSLSERECMSQLVRPKAYIHSSTDNHPDSPYSFGCRSDYDFSMYSQDRNDDDSAYLSADRAHRIARVGALILVLGALIALLALVSFAPENSAEIVGVGATPHSAPDPNEEALVHDGYDRAAPLM